MRFAVYIRALFIAKLGGHLNSSGAVPALAEGHTGTYSSIRYCFVVLVKVVVLLLLLLLGYHFCSLPINKQYPECTQAGYFTKLLHPWIYKNRE